MPLGPGYAIERQVVELDYSAQAPDRVHVRVEYRLQNVGDRELTSLRAWLPSEQGGRMDLRVRSGDREILVQGSEDPSASLIAFPLPSSLQPGQKRTFGIEYNLHINGREPSGVGDFYFDRPEVWLPGLAKPEGFFAEGTKWAAKTDVNIRVPPGFRVLAAGQDLGQRSRRGATEFRFLLRDSDSQPFVVAGPYREQRVRSPDGTVAFWTLQPLPPESAQSAGARLAAAVRTYEKIFGPAGKDSHAVYLVEASEWLGTMPPWAMGHSFPQVAVLNRQAFAAGVTSDAFLALAQRWLARTWFGYLVRPATPLERRLGEALIEYADLSAREARDAVASRHSYAARLLRAYDAALLEAPEKPLAADWDATPAPAQQQIAELKAALFLLALEDRVGQESLHRGLRRMVQALREQSWRVNDLRAALEAESGQNLYEVFRAWLNQTGIPAEFRAAYQERR